MGHAFTQGRARHYFSVLAGDKRHEMETFSCPSITVEIYRDGASTVVELPDPVDCGHINTSITHVVVTTTATVLVTDIVVSLPSTSLTVESLGTALSTNWSKQTNSSKFSRLASSGWPGPTANLSQTYRYPTISPTSSTVTSNSAYSRPLFGLIYILCAMIYALMR